MTHDFEKILDYFFKRFENVNYQDSPSYIVSLPDAIMALDIDSGLLLLHVDKQLLPTDLQDVSNSILLLAAFSIFTHAYKKSIAIETTHVLSYLSDVRDSLSRPGWKYYTSGKNAVSDTPNIRIDFEKVYSSESSPEDFTHFTSASSDEEFVILDDILCDRVVFERESSGLFKYHFNGPILFNIIGQSLLILA